MALRNKTRGLEVAVHAGHVGAVHSRETADSRIHPGLLRIQVGTMAASFCVVGVTVSCRMDVQQPPESLPNSLPSAVVKKYLPSDIAQCPHMGQSHSGAPAKYRTHSQPFHI